MPVERKGTKNGFALVTADDGTMQVEGWIEHAGLGRVYLPAQLPRRLQQTLSLADGVNCALPPKRFP